MWEGKPKAVREDKHGDLVYRTSTGKYRRVSAAKVRRGKKPSVKKSKRRRRSSKKKSRRSKKRRSKSKKRRSKKKRRTSKKKSKRRSKKRRRSGKKKSRKPKPKSKPKKKKRKAPFKKLRVTKIDVKTNKKTYKGPKRGIWANLSPTLIYISTTDGRAYWTGNKKQKPTFNDKLQQMRRASYTIKFHSASDYRKAKAVFGRK